MSENRLKPKEKDMKTDEMKDEYDFSDGTRGMFRGLIEKKTADLPKEKGIAVCIRTDNYELLLPRKIYDATFIGDDLIRVTDETGEEAIYSSKLFLRIYLPAEVEAALEESDRIAA